MPVTPLLQLQVHGERERRAIELSALCCFWFGRLLNFGYGQISVLKTHQERQDQASTFKHFQSYLHQKVKDKRGRKREREGSDKIVCKVCFEGRVGKAYSTWEKDRRETIQRTNKNKKSFDKKKNSKKEGIRESYEKCASTLLLPFSSGPFISSSWWVIFFERGRKNGVLWEKPIRIGPYGSHGLVIPMASTRTPHEEFMYMAKLAKQVECYKEMVDFMEKVFAFTVSEELIMGECNLLFVAYKNRESLW
ncbi:14-3-3-like protein A [Glycine soja]